MRNGIVIIITDNLEHYDGIVKEFLKASTCESRAVSLEAFLDGACAAELRGYGGVRSAILAAEDFFPAVKEKLGIYLGGFFPEAFCNYILACGYSRRKAAQRELPPGEQRFFFTTGSDPAEQAFYLDLYVDLLFKNSTLADRLTHYISDSFKVVVFSELINRKNSEIESLNKELEKKNKFDNLTNLYSRSALFDFLEQERKRTVREQWRLQHITTPVRAVKPVSPRVVYDHAPRGNITDHLGVFSVMMIDLDNFKAINDTYGHLAGDAVLRAFGGLFLDRRILRENDIAGRFGGEEFIVILPGTNASNALGAASRLAESFRRIDFDSQSGTSFNVTISVGISEYNTLDESCEEVIARADKALYHAKEHGRDRIVVYEETLRKTRA